MKRKAKIEVEIDCDKKTCGDCGKRGFDKQMIKYFCNLFIKHLEYDDIKIDVHRCQECLNKFK